MVITIAPVQTWRGNLQIHTTFADFMMFTSRWEGVSLQPVVSGPGYTICSYGYVKTIYQRHPVGWQPARFSGQPQSG